MARGERHARARRAGTPALWEGYKAGSGGWWAS
jgi:hypothetical protein